MPPVPPRMSRFNEDLTGIDHPNLAAEAKRRVEKELAKLKVLDGLSDSCQQKVIDQVFRATRLYQRVRQRLQQAPEQTGFSIPGLRRFNTRLKRLRSAFDDVVDECDELDDSGALREWLGADHVAEVLDEFKRRADVVWHTGGDAPERSSIPRLQHVRESYSSLILVLLVELCGIPKGPASAGSPRSKTRFGKATSQRRTNTRVEGARARS